MASEIKRPSDDIHSFVDDPRLNVTEMGVWTLLREKQSRFAHFRILDPFNEFVEALPFLRRLYSEVYRLNPLRFILFLVWMIWASVEPVLLLYFSGAVLRTIEGSLKGDTPDVGAILTALVLRFACVGLTHILSRLKQTMEPQLRSAVSDYYAERLLEVKLHRDMPTSIEMTNLHGEAGDDAWRAFQSSLDYFNDILSAIFHVFFLSNSTSLTSASPLFIVICLVYPTVSILIENSVYMKDYVVFSSNPDYNRMSTLRSLSESKYKKDILSGASLQKWVLDEHEKAREKLRSVPTVPFWEALDSQGSWIMGAFTKMSSDLPIAYFALQAIMHPSDFSMTSVAVLQQSHTMLRDSFSKIMGMWFYVRRVLDGLRGVYSMLDGKNALVDGYLPYPHHVEDIPEPAGMGVELSDVTFAYPGSKSNVSALNGISLSIKPGQLVVVVGGNGSGKSTLVNVLTRLYDVTSGSVIVDSQPIQNYRLENLRRATAVLTQDQELFPLSVRENIGLGHPSLMNDDQVLMDLATLGGASGLIGKLNKGLDTVLKPVMTVHSMLTSIGAKEHPLHQAVKMLEKKAEVSGGEQQRLAASRVFARFASGDVRLVCVDEPSSALDPEAEWELFKNLRSVRQGKTMVFVTHRFGHLTKYADVIICMKEGKIAEMGAHQDLLKEEGEYAKLYNIQASAFIPDKK